MIKIYTVFRSKILQDTYPTKQQRYDNGDFKNFVGWFFELVGGLVLIIYTPNSGHLVLIILIRFKYLA